LRISCREGNGGEFETAPPALDVEGRFDENVPAVDRPVSRAFYRGFLAAHAFERGLAPAVLSFFPRDTIRANPQGRFRRSHSRRNRDKNFGAGLRAKFEGMRW
jgi:hypothetical protein